MVHLNTIISLSVTFFIALLLPIVLIAMIRRKFQIKKRVFLWGAIAFIVFSQMLEGGLNSYILSKSSSLSEVFKNPWIYMVYGGLAAGIFEEVGRYIILRFSLKGNLNIRNGIGFGIGYAGIESFIIGSFGALNLLLYSVMINNGMFKVLIQNNEVKKVLIPIKDQLLTENAFYWLIGGVERVLVLPIQIAFTIMIFHSIKHKNIKLLIYAILIHAFLDFPAALYQVKFITSSILVMVWIFICSIISTIFLFSTVKSNVEVTEIPKGF